MLMNTQEFKTMFKVSSHSKFERGLYGRFSGVAYRVVTMMAVLGAGVAVMGAQSTTPSIDAAVVSQAGTASDSLFPVKSSDALFSSSAAQDVPSVEASLVTTTPNFAEMFQYGGGQRKRYGRPRYRGNNTNADGSSKYIFYGGAGLSQPIGNTWHYLTPSYGFEVGGGRQFSKHFAVPVEFNWDHFGLTKQTLNNQVVVYDSPYLFGTGAVDGLLDGNSHVWSFSVEPTYTFYQGDAWGAYVEAGAGFYHKTATFTIPQTEQYCDYYYGCYQYQANEPIDSYTSNAPGFDGGFGITYKFSRFSGERFFAEARYVFVDNSQRQGITVNNVGSITSTSTNFYPANSNRTTFIPIKAGIRF
jgi:hypothetical protein